MCGIAGSSNFDTAWDLYEKNLKRGYFSSGFLAFDSDNNVVIKRQKDPFDGEKLFREIVTELNKPLFFLYHSRAPTNSSAVFTESNCHPFEFGQYYVAHNGIITNFKTFPEHPEFIVDSSIIPYHLVKYEGNIQKVYEQYEGLLTSWVYDHDYNSLKVVKAGSSLHMNNNSFSSVSFEGSKPIDDDGLIFELIDGKLKPKLDQIFKYDNPYNL